MQSFPQNSSDKNYRDLSWDTEFFGWKVACITDPAISEESLKQVLQVLRDQKTRLVYCAQFEPLDFEKLTPFHADEVDLKITYQFDFNQNQGVNFSDHPQVKPFEESFPFEKMEQLAFISGHYSRYAVDPHIPDDKFKELYRIWIHRSLKKEIAQEVLVVLEQNNPVGMVTLAQKDRQAKIGLVSVDPQFQGKGYGRLLIQAALKWCAQNHCKSCQVVTQGKNQSACRFYEEMGFHKVKMERFYHFWL